jgi:hypothetical protein
MEETIRLFNALPVLVHSQEESEFELHKPGRTIRNGYILMPGLAPSEETMTMIERIVGISGEKANSSFHKSWGKVQDASIEQLVLEQVIHYFTTYGLESIGMFSNDTVFIPAEKLEIPELEEGIRLTVIKPMTRDEIKDGIRKLGESGIALHSDTVTDIMSIVKELGIQLNVADIQNRELFVQLHQFYGTAPENPEDYLRFLIYVATGESLVIKNQWQIDMLRQAPARVIDPIINRAPENMGEIFLRYKPLFLALRHTGTVAKKWVNQVRKKADKQHKPLKPDYLNSVTDMIAKGFFKLDELIVKVSKAGIWRKVRLMHALNFRLSGASKYIIHRVRNGRAWIKPMEYPRDIATRDTLNVAMGTVAGSIIDDIRPKVMGRVFYIPEYINYALPSSEKQFTGNFPSGTSVEVSEDLIMGVHWTDLDNKRIDLDLSTIDIQGNKIGWDASYRNSDRSILFSGDNTSAPKPNGASELYYIKESMKAGQALMLNYFNYGDGAPVPAKIIVAKAEVDDFGRDYTVNPNNILAQANITVDQNQMILGIVYCGRFYFWQTAIGNGISVRGETGSQFVEFLRSSCIDNISLIDILLRAGAEVVHERPEEDMEYTDLSPENVDKTTFIDLLTV